MHVIAWDTFERKKFIACHLQEKLHIRILFQSGFCMEKEEIIKMSNKWDHASKYTSPVIDICRNQDPLISV